MSSDEDPVSVPPVPAGEPDPDCNLVDSTTSKRDTPETGDNPLEAVPIIGVPRLTREQLEAMFMRAHHQKKKRMR